MAPSKWVVGLALASALAACVEHRPQVPGWDDGWAAWEDEGDGVGPHGCVTEIAAGHSTFECTGPEVSCPEPGACPIIYDVEVPAECVEGGCGLILEIHGGTQFADAIDQITGMRARAGERGFIVVQPNGPYPFVAFPVFRWWFHLENPVLEPPYPPSVIQQEREQITPLLHDFIQDAIRAYDVDEDDVHVTGFSQGGGLTWDLVCAFPDTFASAAPVSAEDPVSSTCFDGVGPEGDIPILRTHGTRDTILDFDLAQPRVENLEEVLGLELEEQRCYGERDGDPCPDGTVSWYASDDAADLVLIEHTGTSKADGIENCEKRFGTVVEDEFGSVLCVGGFPEQGGHCYPGVGGADLVYGPSGLPDNLFQWLSGCGVDPNIEPLSETILDFFEGEDVADADDDEEDAGPYGCVTEIAAGHSTFTCAGPDVSCSEPGACPITYEVEVPVDCVEGGCGLIVDLHGGGQFGDALDAATDMRARAGQRDFIVVQPNGPYSISGAPEPVRLWFHLEESAPGAGDGYPASVVREERVAITALLHGFVQDAIHAYAADEDDVHVTGFSQGGGLTWDLLCAFPDTFASAAPVSAEDPALSTCFDGAGPEGDIPILRTHGTQDLILDFDLAEPRVEDLEAVLGLELDAQRCYGQRQGDPCPDGTVSWYDANEGADLVLIAHDLVTDSNVPGLPDQGGHCYPGVGSAFPEGPLGFFEWRIGCGPDPNIEPLPEIILDFFEDEEVDRE